MKIAVNRREGLPVIDLTGTFDGGEDNCRLVDVISELGRGGDLEAVLNMRRVKWISSTGFGILVRARSAYVSWGGIMRLCELNERALSLIAITQARLLFDVHESESEAIEAARAAS